MSGDAPLPSHLKRNDAEKEAMRAIAESGADRPALMLNMSRYKADAGYPLTAPYVAYIAALKTALAQVGAHILWQLPVEGQPVGDAGPYDEVLAIWFPSHAAFLAFPDAPGAAENYRLRALCLDYAAIHRCPGDVHDWNVSPKQD